MKLIHSKVLLLLFVKALLVFCCEFLEHTENTKVIHGRPNDTCISKIAQIDVGLHY